MNDLESILANIKSIGYFLASQKDVKQNEELKKSNNVNIISDITDIKLADLQFNLNKLSEYFNKIKKQTDLLRIKICVASSSELNEERNAIESYLFWKNDELIKKGIYLHYNVWKKQSTRFNHTYKQEDYNENLVFDSEIFICLIGKRIGKYTKEEFDKGKEKFDKKEKPYVFYVFFKEYEQNIETTEWADRIVLKEHIYKELGQNYGTFRNTEGLILNILSFIDQDIEIVKQKIINKT